MGHVAAGRRPASLFGPPRLGFCVPSDGLRTSWRGKSVGHRSVRYWLEDERPAPDAIALWLEDLVAYHVAHPPPVSSRANETNT